MRKRGDLGGSKPVAVRTEKANEDIVRTACQADVFGKTMMAEPERVGKASCREEQAMPDVAATASAATVTQEDKSPA